MRIGTNPVTRVLALTIVVLACAATTALPSSAQAVICADEPLLGTFDANGDGILMVDEVRQAAPNDERIQSVADQMVAAGVDGIQYRGCEPESDDSGGAGSGATDGDDNAGSSGDNSGGSDGNENQPSDQASGAPDTSTGEEQGESPDADATAVSTPAPVARDEGGWFDERLTVTTLPGVGAGPAEAGFGAGLVALGTTLMLAVIAFALWRFAHSRVRR